MTRNIKASGQPLQALALLGLALPLWIVLRLPDLERRFDRTLARLIVPATAQVPNRAARASAIETAAPRASASNAGRIATLAKPPAHAPLPALAQLPVPVALVPEMAATPLSAGVPAPPGLQVAPAVPSATAFEIATAAYASLAAGDRRGADRGFARAIAMTSSDDPLQGNWRRERQRLNRRWSGDAYTLLRDAGSTAPAASPVLGGGQSGANLAFGLDPLARRPLAILGRLYVAHDSQSRIDGSTAQASIGVRWQAAPGISIAAERLLAIGDATTSDWNLRLAAGGEQRRGRLVLTGYGEAGVRGNGDSYAAGQASAMTEIARTQHVAISVGPGVWGSVQIAETQVSRLDIGLGATARLPAGIAVAADWRWRIAGNADPGSGPAVTISAAF